MRFTADSAIIEFPNAVSAEFCDQVIEMFEADANKMRTDPTIENAWGGRDYKSCWLLHISQVEKWKWADHFICRAFQEVMGQYLNHFKTGMPLIDDGYVVARYDVGDFCVEHKDTSYADPSKKVLSFVLFLNDVEQGGELVFPLQKVSIKPEKGTAVLYPSLFTYRHAVSPVLSNARYNVIAFAGYAHHRRQ